MDIRGYFQKVRETESLIDEPSTVVVSLNTTDGGKEGRRFEVDRRTAAHMLVDGRARLATPQEAAEYHDQTRREREAAQKAQRDAKVNLTLMTDEAVSALRGMLGRQKG